jgi:hypothetical protein
MNQKLKFYVYALPYNSNSGGIIALHKLAHNITLLGEECYIVANNKNENWLGIHIQHSDFIDTQNSVTIYPEIVCGNPFNTPIVVRWLLNTPCVLGGDGIYQDSDLVYKFANYFKAPDESKVLGELTAFDLKLDKFQNLNKHQQGKSCYVIRKGSKKVYDQHPANSIRIDDYTIYGGDDYLQKIFNECETFISYDHANFMSTLAALCGCKSIVIPDGVTSKEEWKAKFPYFSYGIAYGHDDIEWCNQTQHLVKENLLNLESKCLEQTQKMINDCYKTNK